MFCCCLIFGQKKATRSLKITLACSRKVIDLVNCTLAAHIFLLTKVYREWKIDVITSCILFFTVQGR